MLVYSNDLASSMDLFDNKLFVAKHKLKNHP